MLTESQVDAAATLLTDARLNGTLIDDLGACTPTDVETAERIADAHAAQLGAHPVGWKIGATSELAQQIMECDEPFLGRIFSGTVHTAGELIGVPPGSKIESEFAFIVGSPIEPGEALWTAEQVRAATEAVAPAIEIIGTRFRDFTGVGFLSVIADSGANGGVVLGEPVLTGDLPDLAAVPVTCEVDGVVTGSGVGSDVLGDPWNALAWLANRLHGRGLSLEAGQIVMSGTCTGITDLPVGAEVVVDYGDFGRIECSRGPESEGS